MTCIAAGSVLTILSLSFVLMPAEAQTAADTTPPGMVAFFTGSSCPSQGDWSVATVAQGRLLVGVSNASTVGVQVGRTMADQQSPQHYHSYGGAVILPGKGILGAQSSWDWLNNHQGAASGGYWTDGDTQNVNPAWNIPFIQLAVCQKSQQARSRAGMTETDTYPQGSVAFFNSTGCPARWGPASDAYNKPVSGRSLVPFSTPPPGALGSLVGTALSSGEDRQHIHSYSSSIDLSNVSYVLAHGGGNYGLTSAGGAGFSGTTQPSSSAMPYVQLLLCQKTAFQHNTNPPAGVPGNVLMLFMAVNCPYGWKQTRITAGRYLVGLPPGATPEATFGGSPLTPGEDRGHVHGFSGSMSTSSYGIEGASGCCGDGYGGNGTYDYSGNTDPASGGLPYMVVTQCQPCSTGDTEPQCRRTGSAAASSTVTATSTPSLKRAPP
jgi:hypothetical protein